MGYANYLKDLLRPLRLYELDRGPGAAELNAIGSEMDELAAALDSAMAEALPPTATESGLAAYESILPYRPCWPTLDDRRRAVSALLGIDGSSFTLAAVNATLHGCGIRAEAEETGSPSLLRVAFPGNRGMPPDFAELCARIEAILPCHLDVVYFLVFISWAALERLWPTWGELDDAQLTWDELERLGGEG